MSEEKNKNIIAIDPGTKCGWAARIDGVTFSGVWDLSVKRYEGAGMRFVRLKNHLYELSAQSKIDLIVFEEVRRHAGVIASHVYGGIISLIMEFGEVNNIEYVPCPVATLKKFATGKGNAGKELMMIACIEKLKCTPVDDNEADARWLLAWAMENYG